MICPECASPLVTLELSGVEVDHCFCCGGVWLDAGELDMICAARGRKRAEGEAVVSAVMAPEAQRKCPVCARAMDKVSMGEKRCIVDRCTVHGIWFDSGELDRVLGCEDLSGGVEGVLHGMFRAKKEERS